MHRAATDDNGATVEGSPALFHEGSRAVKYSKAGERQFKRIGGNLRKNRLVALTHGGHTRVDVHGPVNSRHQPGIFRAPTAARFHKAGNAHTMQPAIDALTAMRQVAITDRVQRIVQPGMKIADVVGRLGFDRHQLADRIGHVGFANQVALAHGHRIQTQIAAGNVNQSLAKIIRLIAAGAAQGTHRCLV